MPITISMCLNGCIHVRVDHFCCCNDIFSIIGVIAMVGCYSMFWDLSIVIHF
jgi:hypothetical protein